MGTIAQYKAKKTDKKDRLDSLIEEWQFEVPNIGAEVLDVVGRIQYLGNRYEADANKALKQYGIKFTDFDVLGTLRRSGDSFCLSPTQLCEAVLITSGAMTAALDRLEAAGLINRVPDDADRRVKAAALTQKGIALTEAAAKARFSAAANAMSSLSNTEKQDLARLLRKLVIEA